MPGLHARPAAPRLPQRPHRADRGPLGADGRRHAVGRLVHGDGRRRRGRDLLGPRGRRRARLRRVRRPRHARVLHPRALPQARRRPDRRPPARRALRALARGGHRGARGGRARRARRSPRWPRSPARPPRPAATTRTEPPAQACLDRLRAPAPATTPRRPRRCSSASSWRVSSAGSLSPNWRRTRGSARSPPATPPGRRAAARSRSAASIVQPVGVERLRRSARSPIGVSTASAAPSQRRKTHSSTRAFSPKPGHRKRPSSRSLRNQLT